MPQKPRRYSLKTKEAKLILNKASEGLKINLETVLGSKANVEVVEADVGEIYLVGGKPLFFKVGEKVLPTLFFSELASFLPKIVVDMGAVPYVCKGANVMAPGVRRIEGTFKSNSIVAIVDEKFGKPIALGEILFGSEEATKLKQGRIVKNLFYVGDKTLNVLKELSSDDH